MEFHLLLMFSISTGFPIFHLVTIQQWHLTGWSTSSVLAEGCSWKKCSNAPRCSKGATCWSWNIPFWKVPVNQKMIDWVKTSTIYEYVQCTVFAIICKVLFQCQSIQHAINNNHSGFTQVTSRNHDLFKVFEFKHALPTLEGRYQKSNGLSGGRRACLDIFAIYYSLYMLIVCLCLIRIYCDL